jgi:hypothetical protein
LHNKLFKSVEAIRGYPNTDDSDLLELPYAPFDPAGFPDKAGVYPIFPDDAIRQVNACLDISRSRHMQRRWRAHSRVRQLLVIMEAGIVCLRCGFTTEGVRT